MTRWPLRSIGHNRQGTGFSCCDATDGLKTTPTSAPPSVAPGSVLPLATGSKHRSHLGRPFAPSVRRHPKRIEPGLLRVDQTDVRRRNGKAIQDTQRFGEFEPAMDGSFGENGCPCVVKRCSASVGAIPTRQRSLQPVAIGAAVEDTRPSNPSRQHAAWRCGEKAGRNGM